MSRYPDFSPENQLTRAEEYLLLVTDILYNVEDCKGLRELISEARLGVRIKKHFYRSLNKKHLYDTP